MRQIELTYHGTVMVCILDDEDAHLFDKYRWHIAARRSANSVRYYAVRHTPFDMIFLHHDVMGHDDTKIIDHINGNGLDCRRSNMRWATYSQNNANRKAYGNRAHGYKGVYSDKRLVGKTRYYAKIAVDGGQTRIGTYDTPEDAAKAYDKCAKMLHGEFATLNFPSA